MLQHNYDQNDKLPVQHVGFKKSRLYSEFY